MATQRDNSKQEWTGNGRLEDINSGSLQRIADATEKMAASYDQLRLDRDRYQIWYREEKAKKEQIQRRLSALQGVITKMRKTRA